MFSKAGLEAVQKVLVKFMHHRDLSAQEIAERTKCSLPSVYRRIEKLRELGVEIQETKEPRKKTGPRPTKYRIVRFNTI